MGDEEDEEEKICSANKKKKKRKYKNLHYLLRDGWIDWGERERASGG